MSKTRDKIIAIGQRMARDSGYNGFSFREIAKEVGVKSSSIHHHFATKEDLGKAIVENYSACFFQFLGDPSSAKDGPAERIQHYANAFLTSYRDSQQVCLCGILTHEIAALPEGVQEALMAFVEQNLKWLESALQGSSPTENSLLAQSRLIYSTLEGALSTAVMFKDETWLTDATRELTRGLC